MTFHFAEKSVFVFMSIDLHIQWLAAIIVNARCKSLEHVRKSFLMLQASLSWKSLATSLSFRDLFPIGTFICVNSSCGNFGLTQVPTWMYTLYWTQFWSSFFLASSWFSVEKEIIFSSPWEVCSTSLVCHSDTPCLKSSQKVSPYFIITFIKCLFLPVACLPNLWHSVFLFWICVVGKLI